MTPLRASIPSLRRNLIAMTIIAFAIAGCDSDDPRRSPTPTVTPRPSATLTPPAMPTASPTPAATESLLRLRALRAAPDPANGGRIVDADAREVLLRGVNVNALAEYWQGTAFSTTFPLTDADADMMAAIGWNAVRLLISWSRVEPEPGVYDADYLETVAGAVRLLEQRGIYSIIDLHQDAWGATLVARPNEACSATQEPAFGWDGAPGWATLVDDSKLRCTRSEVREISPAVRAAFQAFWDDATGPGQVGIRTRYVRMLGHVAARFANDDAVAGYDLMNEPNALTDEQQPPLSDLYATALPEIRAAEQAAGGRAHLVFFEPSALWSLFGQGAPLDFPHDRDVVYAPHVYTGGLDSRPLTAEAFQIARDEAAGFGGAPVLSGEWGSDPRRADDPGDGYFSTHQQLQDQFRFSATLWTWHESCGDPHKAADYRAGRAPYVWGEFDVDCTTNAIVGIRQHLVDRLTRAYVRAAPGTLVETHYDDATGNFAAHGIAAAPGTELLAFYPAARHGAPALTTTGLTDLRSLPAPGGNVYVVARSIGGEWTLNSVRAE